MKNVLLALVLSSTVMLAADGAALYKKCVACHGINGEKQALGKSKVIAEMTQDELVAAMSGYKDGTYGGSMKALMKGQVATLNEGDITVLAEHISAMKK